MASVFLRKNLFYAKVRLWDASAGAFVWRQVATHCRDRDRALAVALELERASEAAKGALMSRERAVRLVNVVMQLAGCEGLELAPRVVDLAVGLIHEGLAAKTKQKYSGILKRWRGFFGDDRRVDGVSVAEMEGYYSKELLGNLGATAAGDHLRFWRSVWGRARDLGVVGENVPGLVRALGRDTADKRVISRVDMVALVRCLRRALRAGQGEARAWLALSLLGWHTGHRLQDLLGVSDGVIVREDHRWAILELRPAKKLKKEGARVVRLPIPAYVGRMAAGGFLALNGGNNSNGWVSNAFVDWLKLAGVDPLPVQKKRRVVHLKSFHSFRHAMVSRCVAAGIPGDLARLVTDHESARVHKGYVHSEVESLRGALRAVRRV